nr:putative reverse transcriptase domain-containing protein [Tanacetum cinerariifolium]
EFQVGDRVMLKVSPWKGVVRFGKRGKLNPIYIGSFKVLAKVGTVAYRLELPQQLSRVHSTFHMSNLKKCLSDEPLAILLEVFSCLTHHPQLLTRLSIRILSHGDTTKRSRLRHDLQESSYTDMTDSSYSQVFEYLEPYDDEAPLEDQPLPVDASPIAASPYYMADSDPEEDPEDDQADNPADGGDGDDEPFDDDDDDDTDPILPAGDTKALEADEPTPTPRSPNHIIPLSQTRFRKARKTVKENSAAGTARQPGPTEFDPRRYRVEKAGYGITDT